MKRRPLLKLVSLVAATAGAGCVSRPASGDDRAPTATERRRQAGSTRGTPDDENASPNSDDDGAPSAFEGQPCPSFDPDADRTVCHHADVPSDAPVRLRPTRDEFRASTGDGTVETARFVLHNRSRHPLSVDPDAWEIHRRQNGTWSRRASGGAGDATRTVPPDGTHTWSLSVEAHPTPWTEDTTFLTEDLAEGTFAFTVSGRIDADPSERLEAVALGAVVREGSSERG